MFWDSHLFQNFPQFIVIHAVKGFGLVNKAEIGGFLELSCIFHDPADVGNLISCSSAFSKNSLNIWKFMVHVLLKPSLENFEHYFTRMWDECNCAVVWTFFGIAFLWDIIRYFTLLLKLRSPHIFSWQAGDSREPIVWFQFESRVLRNREPDILVWKLTSSRPKKSQCLSSCSWAGQILSLEGESTFFVLFRPLSDLMRTTHVGKESILLFPSY